MADLIDRKELLSKLKPFQHNVFISDCMNIVRKMPPADTERHAHWCYRSTNRFYECSYCGNITYSSEDKYCSNCGCKMDEVEE